MRLSANILCGIIALLHLWFLVMEMFLWNTPFGRKRFNMTPEKADMTEVLAKNQGLYNGFLAAGLIWGLCCAGDCSTPVKTFFLTCVAVAGIYGGLTALRAIIYVQALPALVALLLIRLSSS